jgi:hypothetical protein
MILNFAIPWTFYYELRSIYFRLRANLEFSMLPQMLVTRCQWFDCVANLIWLDLVTFQKVHRIEFDRVDYRWEDYWRRRRRIKYFVKNLNLFFMFCWLWQDDELKCRNKRRRKNKTLTVLSCRVEYHAEFLSSRDASNRQSFFHTDNQRDIPKFLHDIQH